MAKRRGSFLEESVAVLFKKVGFDIQLNTNKFGFEVDVYAFKKGYDIIIECKQYENSYINIGSLLHEWASKGKKVGANKTIVIIAGQRIADKYHGLARELGIYLIDDEKIHYLNSLEKEELKEELNKLIQFDEKAYEKYLEAYEKAYKKYLKEQRKQKRKKMILRYLPLFLIVSLLSFLLRIDNPGPTEILFIGILFNCFIIYVVILIILKEIKKIKSKK